MPGVSGRARKRAVNCRYAAVEPNAGSSDWLVADQIDERASVIESVDSGVGTNKEGFGEAE
jgi:hypothetical protein